MPAAGVVMIIAVVLIVLALVYYLVSTIVALRRITSGLDAVIADVTGIVEKSAPVNEIVADINKQLDAGVDLLEGLLVKKAGLVDAVGLVDGLYPGAAEAGFRNVPESTTVVAPADRRGLHQGHPHARSTRPRGTDRRSEPGRPGPAQHRRGQPCGAQALSRASPGRAGEAAEVAGHRDRCTRTVRTARRYRRPSQTAPQPFLS